MTTTANQALRLLLLEWYDQHARTLPWRVLPADRATGIKPDPYRVWLSEIMLQQTTIATVKPYFERFLKAFPDVQALAAAPIDAVLGRWAGLGYYARGRNLHKCAQSVVEQGGFPRTLNCLAQLPGIGPYTAAAIAAIAFDQPAMPVDGNVERVLSRLLRIQAQLPAAKPVFREAAAQFQDQHRAGDFAQALMDLGSTICTPRQPKCQECPWQKACLSNGQTDVETFPRKAQKKQKALLYAAAFVHLDPDGILVATRPDSGLLAGMLEVPNTLWRAQPWSRQEALLGAPLPNAAWQGAGQVRHIFTHIDLRIDVYSLATTTRGSEQSHQRRIHPSDLSEVALPTVMMKVILIGLKALEKLKPSGLAF